MPVDEPTDFSTPIPLRENGSAERPNPWSRLEAVGVVQRRLQALAGLAERHREPADVTGLAGVLEALSVDLTAAVWGGLDDCDRLRNGASVTLWEASVDGIVWPSTTRPELG